MSAVALFLIFITGVYFWYQEKYKRYNELMDKIPCAKPHPILNHLLYFINKRPGEIFIILEKMAKDHGPVWKFQIPLSEQIVVHDPKIVEEILLSQKIIDKSMEYDFIIDWLGTGLLISTGSKWHKRRKIITPAFHFKILDQFVDIMNKNGDVFVEKLKHFEGREINIYPLISLYALDVVCESAMGYQLNAQTDEDSEYVKAVKEITELLFLRFFDTTKRIKFLYQFTSMYRREQQIIKTLHKFTESVISSRREHLKGHDVNANSTTANDLQNIDEIGMKKKTAFLDLLLQVQVNGQSLSDEGIREEVDTFMFEAHDTTSSAIAFTLLNLAKYKDIQKRVLEECEEILGDDLSQQPTMQDLNKMNYLEKVLKETLRLYPSVPFFARKLNTEFSTEGYTFPKGVSLTVAPYFMGRDPKLFPDPLKFDPSRFDDEKNIRLFSFVPFSAGPRNCIGQKYAMLEMKSIISKLVRNFEITVNKENEEPQICAQLILQSTNGINLSLKPRK
ncbi:hypothetical protein PVAND_000573 [Polypedilum vanderplanki]|uniref:Cytochrome P450 n=1 Tax=Polypedilum vanderplanki TaxID=319348 RepID=A0A9J6BK80_POLVA|nr:hypothetical protein PVAND_000573 [Polypedilum vanderplanki]